jgi:polyhydroxyalkanoate synthesis regulator phasin
VLDSLKRTLLSALKSVALTPDDIRSVLDGFVARGDLGEEQARKVVEALLERGREGEAARERMGKEFQRLSDLLPVVSRSELRDLTERVCRLEERLGPVPEAPEEMAPGGGEAP